MSKEIPDAEFRARAAGALEANAGMLERLAGQEDARRAEQARADAAQPFTEERLDRWERGLRRADTHDIEGSTEWVALQLIAEVRRLRGRLDAIERVLNAPPSLEAERALIRLLMGAESGGVAATFANDCRDVFEDDAGRISRADLEALARIQTSFPQTFGIDYEEDASDG